MKNPTNRAQLFCHLLDTVGAPVNNETSILDLGCGNGSLVSAFCDLGLDARGCDMSFKEGQDVDRLLAQSLLAEILLDPYQLPYPDNSFDALTTDQVFEHVGNMDETNAEISRVLRPDGVAIHIFTSTYTPLEPHVKVPLATVIQTRFWLSMWHSIGVGARAGGSSNNDLATHNWEYLKNHTHYRSHRAIDESFGAFFSEVGNLEIAFLQYRLGNKIPRIFSAALIPAAGLYRLFRDRVLFARK